MHEKTIIRKQLLVGHTVGSQPMVRKEKMHPMITSNLNTVFVGYEEFCRT